MDNRKSDSAPAPDLMKPLSEVSPTTEPPTTEPPTTEPPTQSPAPSLTLGDLEAMLNVISVVTKRGAFEPQELSQVGGLHDRIRAYVEHVKK